MLHATPGDAVRGRLVGSALPAVRLSSTGGGHVDVSALPGPRTVLYCYPRTAEPGGGVPEGWDEIQGARGCTPQSCAFRDHHRELSALGAAVFGASTQSTNYQQEMAARLHLPFPVLSDERFELADAMGLPTFEAGGMRLLRRLTLVVRSGCVETVFYPVPDPGRNAEDVLEWLKANPP